MSIEVRNIRKTFGTFVALDDVSLKVETGELVALLGMSGSGKTTLLRIISGLELPDSGSVHFNDSEATDLSVRDRRVGFVFQHYALFRHMSVFENVAFGLRVKPRSSRPNESHIQRRVHDLLRLVQLDTMAHRLPSQLSGGQRQRVALARALAVEPSVLLLDEPFGALDAKVRMELRRWLRRLHDELHITSVFVTHDQDEALELADRVVVMNEGRIEQIGTPTDVYHHPASPFVYKFLGNVNLFHGRVEDGHVMIDGTQVGLDEGPHLNGASTASSANGANRERATVYVRPHQLDLAIAPSGSNEFRATVVHVNSAGPKVKVELITQWGDPVFAEIDHDRFAKLNLQKGQHVFARPREKPRVFVYQI
jgi:sulfate/thiosulfate transport system ATP-binding protein